MTMKKILSFFIAFLLVNATYADDNQKHTTAIQSWLVAGPVSLPLPAFHERPDLAGEAFEAKQLLEAVQLPSQSRIEAGQTAISRLQESFQWKSVAVNDSSILILDKTSSETHDFYFLATYLEVFRFTPLQVEVFSESAFELFLNGKKKGGRSSMKKADDESPTRINLKLETGKHMLVLKTLLPADSLGPFQLKVNAKYDQAFELMEWSLQPEQKMNMGLVLEGKRITSIQLSPNGQYYLIGFSETTPPEGKTERWYELYETASNKLLRNFRHAGLQQGRFHPEGAHLSFLAGNPKSRKLISIDIMSEEQTTIFEVPDKFGSYHWSPNGKHIVYSTSQKDEKEANTHLKKIRGMPDRWPWWRTRSQLHLLHTESAFSTPLTHGYLSSNFHDFSPDGHTILISQSEPDFTERPYSRQTLMQLNLDTHQLDTIWEKNYSFSATYSPDGKSILLTGSPALFGEAGINLSDTSRIPSDYDTQAFIYHLASGTVDAITYDFHPKILKATWSHVDDKIYFRTEDKTRKRLAVYDPKRNRFETLPTQTDVVLNFDIAHQSPALVYYGNSRQQAERAYLLNTRNQSAKMLAYPQEKDFEQVVFGQTKDWDFKAQTGQLVHGHVYYPPDFDPTKKYPLIVYYYGGTNPVDLSFRGRYPKNYFAALGYVVYTLTPSGSTGFGQDYSSLHVNNWGITVADEIIESTEHFLREHPYIDEEAVGCIGASYGGFMTMLLVTRTDLFAAAISHAGISSISTYWGEGYWGYLYSSTASANSFPWNNRKIYVEQSPLFHADKVNTPLLLLHGANDTNVPPGESIQMYTALKLLGKPAVYIEVEGQDHHIVDYEKRLDWQKAIMSWFDKWLKDQPQWWEELYPERKL